VSRPAGAAGFLLGAIILVVVAFVSALPGLGDRDFWPQDEARYGTVALEMWQGAHPAVPHLNGKVYQDKPPGYFWFVNLAAKIRGGVDEWAARAPSVLGAALLALGAFWMLAPAGGWVAGVVAGLVALSSWLIVWETRQAHLDVLFGGFIALGMAAFTRALEPGRERWTFLGLFLIGLAILVKGPLALVAVATFAVAALLLRRPKAFFNAALLPGLLTLLLPSLFWLGWAYFHLNGVKDGEGAEYIRALFMDQIVNRAQEGRAHVQPWHYYLLQFPYGLIPFFPLLLLSAAPGVWRGLGPMRPAFVVAACWLVLSFVAQSAFPGKRLLYLVPLVVPAAVLCAAAVQTGARSVVAFGSGWAALIGCVLFIAGGTFVAANADDWVFAEGRRMVADRMASKLAEQELDNAESRPLAAAAAETIARQRVASVDWERLRRRSLVPGIAGLVLASIALTALALGAVRTGIAWTAAAFAITIGLALGFVLPAFDPLISRKPVVEAAVAAAHGVEAPIAFLRHVDEAFPYYAARPVPELFGPQPARTDEEKARFRSAASEFLAKKGSVLVVRPDDLEELHLAELAKGRVKGPLRAGGKQFFLLEGTP
jgi:4-amino-4-deoxy-L-arabinose transferase-like glycosyltransferase